jgi:hypothetical protein
VETRYISLGVGLLVLAAMLMAGIRRAGRSTHLPGMNEPTRDDRKKVQRYMAILSGIVLLSTAAFVVWGIQTDS